WISWCAPGTVLPAWPLMAAGLSLGATIRLVAVACYVVGVAGWALWFSRFRLPGTLLALICLSLPLIHYGFERVFQFSAEAFVWASGPWALLAVSALLDRWDSDIRPRPGTFQVVGVG